MALSETDVRTPAQIRAALDAQLDAMINDVADFVNCESPSLEIDRLRASAEWLSALMTRVLGKHHRSSRVSAARTCTGRAATTPKC